MIANNQALKAQFLNLAKCWTFSILHHHKIYPAYCFQLRTTYGISTPVSTSPILNTYIDTFYKNIQQTFTILNNIQLQLQYQGKPYISYRLDCQFLEHQPICTRQQRDTEIKYFVTKMQEGIRRNGQEMGEGGGKGGMGFCFFVEYRCDGEGRLRTGSFVDHWVLEPQGGRSGEELVGVGLKLSDCNMIITKITHS